MRAVRLTFPSYDGSTQFRVGHGVDAVVLGMEGKSGTLFESGMKVGTDIWEQRATTVLSVKEARALGRRLIQQAEAAASLRVVD